MLFVLDKDGVPSVAKTIQLQLGPATFVPVGAGGTDPSKNSAPERIAGRAVALLGSLLAVLLSAL
ncbi:hypothetical protein BC831DRAFT_440958 [Entophlyctis helioformis]|nr:hypothetical protein BC831DRAFT_440958 [Entophlyctis helioformis]